MAENNEYVQKAVTSVIKATSRQSIKIRDSYYTVEYSEERIIPQEINDVDLEEERLLLWDAVNTECDNQITEIDDMWRKHDEELKRKISHN